MKQLLNTSLNTQENIIHFISLRLKISRTFIHPYTNLKDDLNLDTIDMLLLIAELESKFNVYLSSEEAEAIETVEDASFYFKSSNLKKKDQKKRKKLI